jgi:hypothetical protein
LKDVEAEELVNSLQIDKGRYSVCFELGTSGDTPIGEYFLGFEISP